MVSDEEFMINIFETRVMDTLERGIIDLITLKALPHAQDVYQMYQVHVTGHGHGPYLPCMTNLTERERESQDGSGGKEWSSSSITCHWKRFHSDPSISREREREKTNAVGAIGKVTTSTSTTTEER